MYDAYQRFPFVRFLYTQNPFYLLSTALILLGLHVSFGAGGARDFNRWALLASLCGFTLTAAVTALLVIRLGKVWDDARSLLLILLLLFFAISMSLDEICNTQPERAPALVALGFLFAAAVTEGVLCCVPIRLPLLLRTPYYLILGLVFSFPLCVSPEITHLDERTISWRQLAFPLVCSLAFLTLLPAARRGAGYVARVGVPWAWPLFPWSIFFFLLVGVTIRSYLLCISFARGSGMECIFGLHFLAPLWFAVLLIVLEICRAHGERGLQGCVLVIAPSTLVLAAPWIVGGFSSYTFYREVTATCASPLWFASLALIGFYVYAYKRRAPLAEWGLNFSLLAAAFIGPRTIGLDTLVAPQWLPLAALGLWQTSRAAQRRNSLRALGATVSLAAALMALLRETPNAAYSAPLVGHASIVALMLIGAAWNDRLAQLLRKLAAIGVVVFSAIALASPAVMNSPLLPDDLRLGYLAGMALLAIGYWQITRERWLLAAGGVSLCLEYSVQGWLLGAILCERLGPRGFAILAAGTLSFLTAAIISAAKGGLLALLWRTIQQHIVPGLDRTAETPPPLSS